MGEYEPKFSGAYVGPGKAVSNEEVCRILADVVRVDSTFGREGDCGQRRTARLARCGR